ncbi:MAG: 50S ribosomal protein L11 methyltransferase [Verrucomicrobia subdivision 3 bacterium]|nr:50S ribosomal protein L11 methyltransferase [Limisphaerales bacterium]
MWRVSVETTPEAEDFVTAFMRAAFRVAPSAFTNVDTGKTTVSVFLDKLPDRASGIRRFIEFGLSELKRYNLERGSGNVTITRLKREDWAESWKRHFKPFTVGRKLLVKPSWSRRRARPGQKTIVIDPGLSFGTGQHPTTRFCLEQIVAARSAGETQSLLDVGTGSGILAIAAAKLGYKPVHALEVDPNALRVARANARENRAKIGFFHQDIAREPPDRGKYDVVCANLTADILIQTAQGLAEALKLGGLLVLAGILGSEALEVASKFRTFRLSLVRRQPAREWASLALRKSQK